MRFTYLELNNYIGIYNGMGLYQIKIDFTKGQHRICIIKGTNGSGKSTLMNAMSLFPDSSSSFIPDMSASKIVRVSHNNDLYEIKFYSDVRSSTRMPTKAYIAKYDGVNFIELNPNGNVTQYKDIIYATFHLDANFFALSKLSMEDRGIGYRKPADRKRFITSVIDSLEVYNDIYKAISKKANALKVIIARITSNLGQIGDKKSLESISESIYRDIDDLNVRRDLMVSEVSKLELSIHQIDPDDSIQSSYKEAIKTVNSQAKEFVKIARTYDFPNKIYEHSSDMAFLGEKLNQLYLWKNFFTEEKERLTATSKEIIAQISSLNQQIRDLSDASDQSDMEMMEKLRKLIDETMSEATEIASVILDIGIDPNAFTKDEYILALETVHEIVAQVNQLRAIYTYDIISTCIKDYGSTGYTETHIIRYDDEQKLIAESNDMSLRYISDIAKAEADLELCKKLSDRPDGCKIDSCFFIADAVEAQRRNPKSTLDTLVVEYEMYKKRVNEAHDRIAYAEQYNGCMNMMRAIVRSIDKNNSILSRLPNGGIFKSKAEFFERLIGGESFEFIDKLYQYIHFANHLDTYKALVSQGNEYNARYKALEAKAKSQEAFFNIIEGYKAKVLLLQDRLASIQHAIAMQNSNLASAQDQIDHINLVEIPTLDRMIECIRTRNAALEELQTLTKQMEDIDNYVIRKAQKQGEIKAIDVQISYKNREKDNVSYKLKQIAEYESALEEHNRSYDLYTKLKYHSSPTTGIQLMFMKLYMGKILELSNELLSYLFNGQYRLMPFIINEDEFRIPCAGNGYINDDITSMSSSQMTMISMILSFALLTISSTDYNVIKLDEVDDPLDEPNREAIAILLDTIMNIMHTEQCIMISHSSEIIASNADIILLKNDGQVSVDPSANIIWSYMG